MRSSSVCIPWKLWRQQRLSGLISFYIIYILKSVFSLFLSSLISSRLLLPFYWILVVPVVDAARHETLNLFYHYYHYDYSNRNETLNLFYPYYYNDYSYRDETLNFWIIQFLVHLDWGSWTYVILVEGITNLVASPAFW